MPDHSGKKIYDACYQRERLKRFNAILLILTVSAIINTSLLVLSVIGVSPGTTSNGTSNPTTNPIVSNAFFYLEARSPVLAPASWIAVIGVLVWRGRIRSKWDSSRLSQDVFRLMVRMKGSQSRLSLLKELATPRDRLQLARNISLDWKTVDYHIRILLKHGLIHEYSAYANVQLYELTDIGKVLLKVLEDISVEKLT